MTDDIWGRCPECGKPFDVWRQNDCDACGYRKPS